MAQGKKIEFAITAGPPKDELIAALFFNSEFTRHTLSFTLTPHGETARFYGSDSRVFVVGISGIEREGDSDTGWILKGWVIGLNQKFKCHYDSESRKGRFTTHAEA